MASSNEPLARIIRKTARAAAATRPLPGRVWRYSATASPGATHVYAVRFSGGGPANAAVFAGEAGALALAVRDSDDREVECPPGGGDVMSCRWLPAAAGDYRIRIRNDSDAYVGYVVYANWPHAPSSAPRPRPSPGRPSAEN
jgi:hypothetical protein